MNTMQFEFDAVVAPSVRKRLKSYPVHPTQGIHNIVRRIEMKKLIIIVVMALLAGCSDSAREVHVNIMPEGLKDCRYYELVVQGNTVKVMRCPNSTTSTNWRQQSGKSNVGRTSVVVS